MKSSRLAKALGIALAVIVVLFIAGLIGTPYLIDMGMERWIASQGPEVGKVENVDFNPFTGRLAMDNLVVETQSGRTLNVSHAYLQFSWKQLFKKQLYLRELVLQDTFMLVDHLEESGVRVGGLILKELIGTGKKSEGPGWEVGIGRFELSGSRIEYDTPELAATYFIDQYTLSGLETWNKDKSVDMELAGRINESPVHVKSEIKPLAAVKSWKGSIKLEKGSLALLAKLEGLQGYEPAGLIDLDMDLGLIIHEDKSISLDANGNVTLQQLQIQYDKYSLQQEQLSWQGALAASRTVKEGLALEVDGQLAGTGLKLDDNAAALQLLLATFDWQGKTGVNLKDDLSLVMAADFDAGNLKAIETNNNTGLLGLEKFNLAGLEIDGLENIRLGGISMQELRLIEKREAPQEGKEKAPPLLQTAAIDIDSISLQETVGLSIDSINIRDLAADIRRDKQGVWQVMVPMQKSAESPGEPAAPKTGEPTEKGKAFTFRINTLQADGSNVIHFADESLPRPFQAAFNISELQVENLNSADPSAVSSFRVKGKVGDYSEIAFDGTSKPAEKPATIDTKGTVSSLDMVPLSSYTGKAIGYNVTSGQMDADINVKIDKGMMDGVFDLRMRKLEVAQVDPDKEPEVDKQMDVPLGSALSMLRNKKDEINLELKLHGDIRNPEFGIQDAINQALAKAMQFATLSYLKYTLQPFGTYIAIAEVVGKAGKEMSKVGLDPVLFPAGEISLTDTANQYLGKIKDLLDNRPKLRIELCGRAVEKDRLAMIEKRMAVLKKEAEKSGKKLEDSATEIVIADEVLLDFARERAKLVKESLVNQHSVNHERIFVCLPEMDDDPAKEPYVEMRLD